MIIHLGFGMSIETMPCPETPVMLLRVKGDDGYSSDGSQMLPLNLRECDRLIEQLRLFVQAARKESQ